MNYCKFGCGQKATYQFKDGTFCCNKIWQRCPIHKKNVSKQFKNKPSHLKGTTRSQSAIKKNSEFMINYWKDENHRKEQSDRLKNACLKKEVKYNKSIAAKKQWGSKEFKEKMSKIHKLSWEKNYDKRKSDRFKRTIKYIKEKYPTFAKIEEMRYKSNEIQVHCKNHKCKNSKEQGGWFTPTGRQIELRISTIEHGNGGGYFYCSDKCKIECPLFNLRYDPNRTIDKLYTSEEYQTWRKEVFNRNGYYCEYCGDIGNHVHHSRPQKLEPGFVLDPDFGIVCCEKCHYKYGHKTKTKCSTGQLASTICK